VSRRQQQRGRSARGPVSEADSVPGGEPDPLEGEFRIDSVPGAPIKTFFLIDGASQRVNDPRVDELRTLLGVQLRHCDEWLEERLQTRRLCVRFELGQGEIRDDTLASELHTLLLKLRPDGTSDPRFSVAGDEAGASSRGFRFEAYWKPGEAHGPNVDKSTVTCDNRFDLESLAVMVHETREVPSPSPSEPEGSDVGEISSTDAQLLFETVKSFRAIRDRHRLGHLARVLGLNMPLPEEPTIPEVEKLINRLGGKSFGSFEANHIAAQELQGLLSDLGLRVACPKKNCGQPASLYHRVAGRARNGVFVFSHAGTAGTAYHAGSSWLPDEIRLVRSH
jgi:hypothetical protein